MEVCAGIIVIVATVAIDAAVIAGTTATAELLAEIARVAAPAVIAETAAAVVF